MITINELQVDNTIDLTNIETSVIPTYGCKSTTSPHRAPSVMSIQHYIKDGLYVDSLFTHTDNSKKRYRIEHIDIVNDLELYNSSRNAYYYNYKAGKCSPVQYSYSYSYTLSNEFIISNNIDDSVVYVQDTNVITEVNRANYEDKLIKKFKPKNKRVVNSIPCPILLPSNPIPESLTVSPTNGYDTNYGTYYIRGGYRGAQLIYFREQLTKIKLDYYTKYYNPVQFVEGISNDYQFVELYHIIGSNSKLNNVLKQYDKDSPVYKKTLSKMRNELEKEVCYIIAVNMMNGVINYNDINSDIILQCMITVVVLSLNYISDYEYVKVEMKDLEFEAKLLMKKFFNGSKQHLMSKEGVLNFAFNFYGNNYSGVRYPEGYTNEQKNIFKINNGIERKKHKQHKQHKQHKDRIDSLASSIRECYNTGMKQKDVVLRLHISKGVVSKWYNKFKSE